MINSFALWYRTLTSLNLSRLFQHERAQAQIKHCSTGIRSFAKAPAAT